MIVRSACWSLLEQVEKYSLAVSRFAVIARIISRQDEKSDNCVIASSACRGVCGAKTVVGTVNRAADRLEAWRMKTVSHRGHRGHRGNLVTSLCPLCPLWLFIHMKYKTFFQENGWRPRPRDNRRSMVQSGRSLASGVAEKS